MECDKKIADMCTRGRRSTPMNVVMIYSRECKVRHKKKIIILFLFILNNEIRKYD